MTRERTPCYLALDCIPTWDGDLRVVDLHGGVGGGLAQLAAAYGGTAAARARLRPYLERLAQVAGGRRILFLHDPFLPRQPFPDDFFAWVQRLSSFGPITDWVPDLDGDARQAWASGRAPRIEEMGVFLEPLAGRLRIPIAYCSALRIDTLRPEPGPLARGRSRRREDASARRPMLLLSGYRERARARPESVILPPEEVGAVVFSGASDRFPEDLAAAPGFPVVNPPLLDRLLENRWLASALLEGSPAAARLPRWIPVGMGLRTAEEVRAFAAELHGAPGFPLAVLLPSHTALAPGARFVDRTGLRALAARQPERRLPASLARELLAPRIAHSYEEIAGYRGKLLDNLLRIPGAEVVDHGDGTFHYVAPYPFLETTVAVLQEYIEARPVRSRRTGKLHRGSLRVVFFDRRIVAAIYRLEQEPDDGLFRDPTRPDTAVFYEAATPEAEAEAQRLLGPLVAELEERFWSRIRTAADLAALRERWLLAQAARE